MVTVSHRVRELAEALSLDFSRLNPADRIALLNATVGFELTGAVRAYTAAVETNSQALFGAASRVTGELN